MKLKMRRGKIKRPPGAKEPIIRLVGNAEAHLIHDEEQVFDTEHPKGLGRNPLQYVSANARTPRCGSRVAY